MTEKCFDEGTIQSFLDGELAPQAVDGVSRHIAICGDCARSVAEAENEIELAYAALDTEDNELVPTERLWTKINYSIGAEAKSRSVWQSVIAFLSSPSAIGFASLLIVFGLFIGLYGLKNGSNFGDVATGTSKSAKNTGGSVISTVTATAAAAVDHDFETESQAVIQNTSDEGSIDHIKADFRVKDRRPVRRNRSTPADVSFPSDTLLAEESYIKTISTLESTVNTRKDEVLKPSARFSYERDIAVANDTIKKMKDEVRKDPNNSAARILLRNSYQNKIDLLNSLAEKSELMASLN